MRASRASSLVILAVIAAAPANAQTAVAPDAAPPAGAASAQANWQASAAFVANAFPSIHFLDQTSRMAMSHSNNGKVRDLAQEVAKEETTVGNSLAHWVHKGGSVVPDQFSPNLHLAVRLKAPKMLPEQAGFLQRLSTLQGRDFDAMCVSIEKEALQHLAAVYQDYALHGDDPSLQAIAARELPEVKRLIVTLGGL